MAPRRCTPKRLSTLALVCATMAVLVLRWIHLRWIRSISQGVESSRVEEVPVPSDDRGSSPVPTRPLPQSRPATKQHTTAPPGRPPEGALRADVPHDALGDTRTPLPAKPLNGYVGVPRGKPLQLHCRECALVSSSGQMLGTGAGPDIDSTECVWRMNNAVLGPQYRADVGARSTVRVVSHTSVPLLAKRAASFFSNGSDNTQGNATYVVWGPLKKLQHDSMGSIYRILLEMKTRFPSAQIFTLTNEQMQRCDKIFEKETGKDRLKSGAYLSTGWFTMVLAMEVCDSIHVYGMIDDGYCSRPGARTVPYHYYGSHEQSECSVYAVHEQARAGAHRFITEKTVFGRWAKRHRITFSYPTWPTPAA